jgi:serine/threonine protein kinase
VNYIHSFNPPVLHQDLKSLNVLLDGDSHCKVSDFGLAVMKSATTTKLSSAKGEEESRGTTQWMAPELFDVNPHPTFKSDMYLLFCFVFPHALIYIYLFKLILTTLSRYALGIIFWEIATRQIPFRGAVDVLICKAVKKGQRPLWPDDFDGPSGFKDLACQCWDQNPSSRPSIETIVEILVSLREKQSQKDESLDQLGSLNPTNTTTVSRRFGDIKLTHLFKLPEFYPSFLGDYAIPHVETQAPHRHVIEQPISSHSLIVVFNLMTRPATVMSATDNFCKMMGYEMVSSFHLASLFVELLHYSMSCKECHGTNFYIQTT